MGDVGCSRPDDWGHRESQHPGSSGDEDVEDDDEYPSEYRWSSGRPPWLEAEGTDDGFSD